MSERPTPSRPRQRAGSRPGGDHAWDELTPAQVKELERRVADVRDRRRFLLVSVMTPRHVLYYDVAEDAYAVNEPTAGTLFKRHRAAAAIVRVLRGKVAIAPCRVDRRGRLVRRSVVLPPR